MPKKMVAVAAAFALAVGLSAPVRAETLKAAIGQKGAWTTGMVSYGMKAGIFQKHGLDVEVYWTQGGAPTVQALMAGSVDMAIDTGLLGIIGAYVKGAPLRVFSPNSTGAPEIYWYAKKSSGIKSIKDAAGKTVAFSENGSSSNLILLALLQQNHIDAKPVATGGLAATLTQLMTGQIDVGWGVPPVGLKQLQDGETAIVARGNDVLAIRNETVRVNVATADTLKTKHDAFVRFMQAYKETIDWAYKDPRAAEYFAADNKVSVDLAKQALAKFFPKSELQLTQLKGMDLAMKQAADYKYTPKPMTPADVKGLFALIKP